MDTERPSKPMSWTCSCASSCRTDSSDAAKPSNHSDPARVESESPKLERAITTVDRPRIVAHEAMFPGIEDIHDSHSQSAHLLRADHNPPVIRKFESLHTRVILFREYELHSLEQELLALDKAADNTNDHAADIKLCQERSWGGRTDLINRIDDKLREYHDAVQRAKSFSALPKPAQTSFMHGSRNRGQLLAQLASNTPYEDDDFISIVEGKGPWIDRRLHMAWSSFRGYIPTRSSMSGSQVHFVFKSTKVTCSAVQLVAIFITIMTSSLFAFFIPTLSAHNTVDPTSLVISLIVVCSFIFTVLLCLFTQANRHEVVAATSAYCAVLVVFVSNATPI